MKSVTRMTPRTLKSLTVIADHNHLPFTSRTANPIIMFDGSEVSSTSFLAVSTPATGTRYSNSFGLFLSADPGTGYGNGRYSGSKPSCRSTVPWSHAICSWYNLSPRILTMLVKGMLRGLKVGGMPGILSNTVGLSKIRSDTSPKEKNTYNQSMTRLWVHSNRNSSTIRSIPTVLLTSCSFASSGLLNIK